ncbi:MAG TPA: AIPR family protein [Solirubrobacteraceae bacterium]
MALDRITKSLLDDFVSSEGLEKLPESDAFERFAAYCAIAREHSETFNPDDVIVSGGNDTGIDAIAVIVNGSLISSVDELNDLLAASGYIEATFVFVQAKTGTSFDAGEIGTFCTGVRDFFSQAPALPRNSSIEAMAELQTAIYDNSARFRRGNPHCRLRYVCAGRWTDDIHLQGRVATEVEALQALGLFAPQDGAEFVPIDADRLQVLYRDTQHRVTAEFQFPSRTVLPEMEHVTEAYLGVLPASEYLKLIVDDADQLRRPLFYDNVRDFQDFNVVNEQIKATLESPDKNAFALLNNGVTIVTRQLTTTGNKFVMEDYQIVNGCQTSHVLYREREQITDDVYVPIKVIATTDDDLTNAVIRATNSQTPIGAEDLQALSGFQKKLEAFYAAFPERHRLYYERRSKQYEGLPGIEKVRIVTRGLQIRAFAAMFLDEPHRAGRYFSTLLNDIGERIFADDHRLEMYYASAYAHYRLEFLFRNGLLDVAYKPARYHLLTAVRHGALGAGLPQFNSHEMERKCTELLTVLHDDTKSTTAFKKAAKAVDAAVGADTLDRDLVRTQTFTDAVVAAAGTG